MKLIKFIIFYTFVGVYQTGIYISRFLQNITQVLRGTTVSIKTYSIKESLGIKASLLRTAFRSIL